jgi:hypothetical protein
MESSSNNAATVQVAGYGKHPAWSDHIEGLGAANPVLSKIEGELYLGAIGSLITSGDWPSGASTHAMARTVRRFLCQSGGDIVFGWMWPSTDEVGRDHYPMILCVHVTGADARAVVSLLDPLVQQAMQAIRATRLREEVLSAVLTLEAQARKALQSAPTETDEQQLQRVGEWLKTGPLDTTRWHRLLYFLKTQYTEAAITETGSRLTAAKRSGTQEFEGMRLPLPASAGPGALTDWLAFLRTQLRSNAPALLIQPEGADWCDIIVGAINATTLKPILGPLDVVYPVTDVPFEITPDLVIQAEQVLGSVALPWGDPNKVSIFGPVPVRYRPGPSSGRPAPAAARSPAPEPASSESKPERDPRPAAAGSIPWKPIAAGVVAVVGIVLFLVFRGGGQSSSSQTNAPVVAPPPPVRTPARETPSAGGSTPVPVASGDVSGRWLLYWEQHGQLKDVAGSAAPGTFWAELVRASLADLDPKNWDPWVVVFGGRDKVRGAEIDNISVSRLNAQAANLQRGADAAARLMSAATNGYAARIRSELPPLAAGPAAGLVTGWQTALAAPVGTRGVSSHVQALGTIETQWRQVTGRSATWSNAWAQVSPLDPQQAATLQANDRTALQQVRDPAAWTAAVDASVALANASKAWAQRSLPGVDRDFLAARIAKEGPGLTWTGWSNAVVGATRVVSSNEIARVKEALRAEMDGDRLQFLQRVRKDQGDAFRTELTALSGRLAEVSQVPLVAANPEPVARFRTLQTQVAEAASRLQKSWSLVASPKAQVQLSRDTRTLKTPLQEFWQNYLDQAARKVDAEPAAEAAASTLRWTETLDVAWSFFSALEGGMKDTVLVQAPQPLSGRVPEADWRRDVWSVLQAHALQPETLRFKVEAGAAASHVQREVAGVISVVNAALQLKTAWTDGVWTNTTTPRGIVTAQGSLPAFPSALKAFDVARFRALAADTWSKPLPETAPAAGADLSSISALCERIVAEPGWAATDAHWKVVCDLAASLAKAGTWKDLTRQKAWFGQLWKARVGGGLSIDTAKAVTGAVAAHPGLEGWLPSAFLGHQRWSQIHAALASGQLNEAKQQVDAFRSDIAKGRVPESSDNKALLEQLAALKLPEDPFERVDWDRTRGNRPFTFEINNASKEAVAVFASGARVTFILPPTGVAAPILVAREELSARALAAVLNGNPGLLAAWLELKVGTLLVARTGTDAKAARVASVWNNLATSGGKALPDGPRIREGSAYSEVGSGPFNAPGVELPANCVSAVFAEAVVAAIGCRLPSPVEWNEINSRMPEAQFPASPKAIKALCKKLEELWAAKRNGGLLEEDFGWLATGVGGTSDRGTGPFFQSVSAGGGNPQSLRHWHGNVAEYLRDPQTGVLSVAGGSFANPNVQPQPLGDKEKTQAFIDAGLRLVLDRVDLDQVGQARSLMTRIRLVAP